MNQIYLENSEYEILTPNGWEDFDGVFANFGVNKPSKKLTFSDGSSITATLEHRFFIDKKEICVSEILVGCEIDSEDGRKLVVEVEDITLKDTYEIFNAENHKIVVNGIYSHQCDEFAFIHNNLADDFFTSVFPTISSGKNTKFIMSSTPKGMNLFYKFWTDAKAGRNGFMPYEVHWSQVPGRDKAWYEETIKAVGTQKFDQEYNCHFLGSTNTLISGEKLATLTYKEPISKMADVVIYEKPIKEEFDDETQDQISTDHLYAIVVDVSEGKNLDYSAFSVFDVSMIPYRQVAVYRNNNIPPMIFPNIIKSCAEYYNDAHVLIEINNSPQVAEILLEDLEYENVFKITSGNKKAQTLSLGSGRRVSYGLKTSPLSKRVGCSTLKTLIENDKLILNDFETISELTTFVNNGKSFAAEEGCNDDLAMTLVNFGWLVTQKLFKEMVDNDIRKQLQLEHFEYIEEDQLPLGENYKGNEIPFYIEDDAVWVEVGKNSSQNDYGDFYKSFISF